MSQFEDAQEGAAAGMKRKIEEVSGGEATAEAAPAPKLPESLKNEWIACPRLGNLVGYGPFVPCKPPIVASANDELDEGDQFNANMFMDRQISARRDIGMVISLLDPARGWPTPEAQEWEDWDLIFVSIKPESAQQVAADVQRTVRAYQAKNPRGSVAIYCEDGCNLTGYAIVSFLKESAAMPLQDALQAFADARPPGIFHPEYLNDLWKRHGGAAAPPHPPRPEWASDKFQYVHAQGAFSLPHARSLPRPVAPGEEEVLPAGWSKHWSKTHQKPYYFHRATGKQLWTPPPKDVVKELEAVPSETGPVETCQALHILVKHQESRRKTSWKDKEGKAITARTRQMAAATVIGYREQLAPLQGQALQTKFASMARLESDCSSAMKSGDLGAFKRGSMQPAFEKAAFALKPGELSQLVETDSGCHIILRIA